ncbi:hypothetical protein E2C01_074793 [Portunus trituberculatus]|uniref:Uncharacterized protein n=1 Tax=Portunus trituberculatus TaxID=210409 RepID=A0A5B7I6S1_PORTR|nr:hypothetical protein [Portunus trituberculatus]
MAQQRRKITIEQQSPDEGAARYQRRESERGQEASLTKLYCAALPGFTYQSEHLGPFNSVDFSLENANPTVLHATGV